MTVIEKQQSWNVSSQKKQKKMNLVALLFFMMGAFHIYSHLQHEQVNGGRLEHLLETNRLLILAVLGILIASIIELLIF
jgi:hypothetical protein